MLRLSLGLSLVALALGCNGGIGVTDASSYSSTTNNPASDPSNSDPSSASDPTTTSATGTSAGTGTGSGGQESSGSDTGDSTGAATSSPTSGPTTTASTGDTTTGEPAACKDLSLTDHGNCDMFLGYGFDGTACRAFSGCDCGDDCDNFFADAVDCATSCAATGGCNEAAIQAAFLAMDPVGIGTHCDEVDACAVQDTDAANWIAELFPGSSCDGSAPCKQGQACVLQFSGTIDAEQWQKLCAASLLPNAELYCVVFGP